MRFLIVYVLFIFATPSYSFFNSRSLWHKVCPVVIKEIKKKIKKNHTLSPHTKQLLQSSIKRFKSTPGFIPTIHTLLAHTSVFEGTLFEVICGRDIDKQTPVIGFNQIKNDSHNKAQFDLIVAEGGKEYWVECKRIDWQKAWSNRKRRKILQEQFIRQKKIVEHNHMVDNRISYYVCSGTPVCPEWDEWFSNNNIEYCEHFKT